MFWYSVIQFFFYYSLSSTTSPFLASTWAKSTAPAKIFRGTFSKNIFFSDVLVIDRGTYAGWDDSGKESDLTLKIYYPT